MFGDLHLQISCFNHKNFKPFFIENQNVKGGARTIHMGKFLAENSMCVGGILTVFPIELGLYPIFVALFWQCLYFFENLVIIYVFH